MFKVLEARAGGRIPQIVVSFTVSDYGKQQNLSQ